MMSTTDDDPKLLVLRYKSEYRFLLNTYCSFSNAIQYPGLVNFEGHRASIGNNKGNSSDDDDEMVAGSSEIPPSLFDYFGYGMTNLLQVVTDPNSLVNNFDILTNNDWSSPRCKMLFRNEPPRFFFIESRLAIQSKNKDYEGQMNYNYSFEDHYVAVVYKDEYYYICPGEENSLVYRVGCPEKIFLTEDGHRILSIILRDSLGTDFGLTKFRLLVPKQHINRNISKNNGWDRKSTSLIKFQMPYPVLASASISHDCHSSVQVVKMIDDKDFIVNILVGGEKDDDSSDDYSGDCSDDDNSEEEDN